MLDTWNKAEIWKQATRALAEEVDPGVMNMLHYGKAYLDSIERDIALIGVQSGVYEQMLNRRRIDEKLAKILSDLCGKSVRVLFVNGRPRIIERRKNQPVEPSPASEEEELAMLHAKYGDIMGIVNRHPVFVRATTPMVHGGWGYHKEVLTNYCKDYGPVAVLKGLREVAADPSVKRPRVFFRDELKAGRWGHKLTVTPSLTGA